MLRMEYDEAKTMAHIREDSYEEGELAGQQIGQKLKLIEMVCKKIKKNKTMKQIADELEEQITDIEEIYETAEKFSPDYNVNEIYEAMKH